VEQHSPELQKAIEEGLANALKPKPVPPPTERVLPARLDPLKVYKAKTRDGVVYKIEHGTFRRDSAHPKESKKERVKRRRSLKEAMEDKYTKI